MAKILIMDDEQSMRNIIHNIVKPLGHEVFTAEDGRQALDVAKEESIDIALLDVRVPDMDGLEALAELRKINPGIKAIMLSGFGDAESAAVALKQGAFDYISKPFKVEDVIKAVNKAMSAAERSRPAAEKPSPETAGSSGPAQSSKIEQKESISKRKFVGIAAGAMILLAAAFFAVYGPSPVLRTMSFAISYANPAGMCWIDPHLWIGDAVTGDIYRHNDDDTLSTASVFKAGNARPTGLAFDGEALWTCSPEERRIYRHRMDETLSVAASYETPGCTPAGLYSDGMSLWVLDAQAAKIYRHKMDETLAAAAVFESPAAGPCGMFRNGEYFYIGDRATSRIYKVLAEDLSVKDIYALPGFGEGKNRLAGIAWDGSNIWAGAEGAGKVFKIQLNHLKRQE